MTLYDEEYFSDLERADRVEYPRNLRTLLAIELYKKGGKLLDVGIGTGLFLKIAKKRGWDIYGIDISSYAIKSAKQTGAHLRVKVLSDKTFKENFFDAVNMRHSLEHIKNPQKILEIIYKILKPEGIICITTPNSFGLHAKIFGKLWPHLDLEHHVNFFSKKSLKKLVDDAGFKTLHFKTEELTAYDIFKLFLFKLGLLVKYRNPWKVSFLVNEILAKIGLGEGLVLVAKKV